MKRRWRVIVAILAVVILVGASAVLYILTRPKAGIDFAQLPEGFTVPQSLVDRYVDVAEYVKQTGAPVVNDKATPVAGQFALNFKTDVSDAAITTYLESIHAQLLGVIPGTRIYLISGDTALTTNSFDSSLVDGVEQNYTFALSAYPINDPEYTQQWSIGAMNVPAAWDQHELLDRPRHQVTIAVIDSGACFTHPDLADVYLAGGYDYINVDQDPTDDNGHGCAVAGVIAAKVNNTLGIAGIAPNVHILPYKVTDAEGYGTLFDVAAAIGVAADAGVDAINLSLGMAVNPNFLEQAVQYALGQGVVVIAAAGNAFSDVPEYPAAYDGVISVGAVDNTLQRAWFSNYGATVDTWAPGQDVLSTALNGGYELVSGTSFAAPNVTGLWALERIFCRDLVLGGAVITAHPEQPFTRDTCYPNQAPVFTSNPVTTATAGDIYATDFFVTDADNDQLNFTLVANPEGMYIYNDTVLAKGIAVWPSPVVGTHVVTARVSDGRATADQTYTITVQPRITPVVPVNPGRTPLVSQVFQNAEPEYNAWQAANPNYTCAATVLDYVSTTDNFTIWYCSSLNATQGFGLQIIRTSGGTASSPEVDRIPVKFTMNSWNIISYQDRIITANGYVWGADGLVNAVRAAGLP